jgi:hypothetical protein
VEVGVGLMECADAAAAAPVAVRSEFSADDVVESTVADFSLLAAGVTPSVALLKRIKRKRSSNALPVSDSFAESDSDDETTSSSSDGSSSNSCCDSYYHGDAEELYVGALMTLDEMMVLRGVDVARLLA